MSFLGLNAKEHEKSVKENPQEWANVNTLHTTMGEMLPMIDSNLGTKIKGVWTGSRKVAEGIQELKSNSSQASSNTQVPGATTSTTPMKTTSTATANTYNPAKPITSHSIFTNNYGLSNMQLSKLDAYKNNAQVNLGKFNTNSSPQIPKYDFSTFTGGTNKQNPSLLKMDFKNMFDNKLKTNNTQNASNTATIGGTNLSSIQS